MKVSIQPQSRVIDRAIGSGLALAAFGLYLATLAPTVLEADGGEFQFVPWLPGIAHPTGYPLYILLGWLWTHLLPIGEVAWRMNLLSAVLAAAAVGLTYAVARQILDRTLPDTPFPARIIAAVMAAATFAVSHTFWSQALIAEVYTLHALFVAALLWLAVNHVFSNSGSIPPDSWEISRFARNDKTSRLLALTLGLSLTHHRTIVLLLPALVLFLLTTDRRPPTAEMTIGSRQSAVGGRSLLIHTALLVVPLLLYLYLPLVAPSTPYATLNLSETQRLVLYDNSWQGFWRHIMGSVFSGELMPSAAGLDRLELVWQLLRQQVGWVGAILALAGLMTLWQRRQSALLLLTGLSSVVFVAFNLIYFIGDVFVLFIPVWLFVCLWLGLGSLGVAHWLAQYFVQSKTGSVNSSPGFEAMEKRLGQRIYRFVTLSLAALGLLLPSVLLATRYPELDQSHNMAARERWQAVLAEPLPEGAILLSNDRNEIMPLWYYQYVEGRRPDVLGLFPLIVLEPAYANVGRVLDQALVSGRPVYLIKPMTGLEIKADLSPAGSLFRATPNHAPPAHLLNLKLPEITLSASPSVTETITLLGYDLSPAKIHPGTVLTVTLHWQASQPLSLDYTSYVHLVNSNGQGLTQSDHRPGSDFYPSHYWQTGEIVRDPHLLTVPAAIPPGEYRLRVGMYDQPEPGVFRSMGTGVEIGTLLVE
ncbi:MAG: DUF2723 domain-containing protein [Anaerolineales bacterium]|nr:DUF2723 domain-containing protein [Anaerolineales bacterium]